MEMRTKKREPNLQYYTVEVDKKGYDIIIYHRQAHKPGYIAESLDFPKVVSCGKTIFETD